MKHIHVVSPYQSAAMIRMTAPLEEWLKNAYEVTVSAEIDPHADLNYHIPYHTLVGVEGGRHAFMYTHCNVGDEAKLIDACERAEMIACMSFTGRQELADLGVDPKKLWVIYSGTDPFKMKRRNIGIIGYEQPNGRKRSHILLDLAWQMDLSAFHFVICGTNWEPVANKLAAMGASLEVHEHLDWPNLNQVYQQLDLLLVTAYAEGGPLPLLEAMACGVPVLAPNVGYAADLLEKDRIYADETDLRRKLEAWSRPIVEQHQLVKVWSWKHYAEEHAMLFGRILGDAIDLFSNSGMSRYAQILEIIDEIKPRTILEIGTWTGERALQMILEAARFRPIDSLEYQGYDLFEDQTPEHIRREFSKIGVPMGVVERRLNATGAQISLVKGLSRKTLPSWPSAELYFIDGGHSVETIREDWERVRRGMGPGSVVIFDDYYVGEHPEEFGCNQIVDGLDPKQYEVTHLPVITDTGELRIGMVKVRHGELHLHGQEEASVTDITSHGSGPEYLVSEMRTGYVAETAIRVRELERAPALTG
jgi:predicted O-methyltransferase YrrM